MSNEDPVGGLTVLGRGIPRLVTAYDSLETIVEGYDQYRENGYDQEPGPDDVDDEDEELMSPADKRKARELKRE